MTHTRRGCNTPDESLPPGIERRVFGADLVGIAGCSRFRCVLLRRAFWAHSHSQLSATNMPGDPVHHAQTIRLSLTSPDKADLELVLRKEARHRKRIAWQNSDGILLAGLAARVNGTARRVRFS